MFNSINQVTTEQDQEEVTVAASTGSSSLEPALELELEPVAVEELGMEVEVKCSLPLITFSALLTSLNIQMFHFLP